MTLGPASVTAALLVALTVVLMFLALRSRLSVAAVAPRLPSAVLDHPGVDVSATGSGPTP